MRLRRVDRTKPGITRRRCGRGFRYAHASGEPVEDADDLARIRALAIPPAWTDVWICDRPNGHLQAVGTDDAGRLQYLYHEQWRLQRDGEKFAHVVEFGEALPRLRERVSSDLAGDALGRDRVLALAVRMLDRGSFRVGSEAYAQEHGSYGLSTLRRCDVSVGPGDRVTFDYDGKSGQHLLHSVVDTDVARIVRALKRRRSGDRLLAWKEGRVWRDVQAADINAYIKDAMEVDASAKDFRTWNATVLAAVALGVSEEQATNGSPSARKRAVARAVREVADHLGNTPAVCRASYVDPRVIEEFERGHVIDLDGICACDADVPCTHGGVERELLELLTTA